MPCKLSSQVRTCLFICDSLLSPINKSKRGSYLGRSISLVALKHNLLGHERKHRCSRTPVKLHITTSWRMMPAVALRQARRSRKAARLLSRLHCWPCSGALRRVSTTLVHQGLLCREQMSPPSLHSVPFLIVTPPCRVKERHWMYRGWFGGPVLAAPASKRFRKRTERYPFYEWLLRVLDENYNLSRT